MHGGKSTGAPEGNRNAVEAWELLGVGTSAANAAQIPLKSAFTLGATSLGRSSRLALFIPWRSDQGSTVNKVHIPAT